MKHGLRGWMLHNKLKWLPVFVSVLNSVAMPTRALLREEIARVQIGEFAVGTNTMGNYIDIEAYAYIPKVAQTTKIKFSCKAIWE